MPKATNEHTTPGHAPPGATRRSVIGAAAMLLAGSAAGAADAAPPANPDAELLAQCAEFTALERRYAIVCHAAQTTEQEHATAPLTDAIAQRQKTLVSAMGPATTRQGMRAKAQCLALYAPEFADGTFEGGGMLAGLIASLMADVIEGAAP